MPYRIAVAHSDKDHPNHAPFTWRRSFDSADEAQAALKDAEHEYPAGDGYSHTVEELTGGANKSTWKET